MRRGHWATGSHARSHVAVGREQLEGPHLWLLGLQPTGRKSWNPPESQPIHPNVKENVLPFCPSKYRYMNDIWMINDVCGFFWLVPSRAYQQRSFPDHFCKTSVQPVTGGKGDHRGLRFLPDAIQARDPGPGRGRHPRGRIFCRKLCGIEVWTMRNSTDVSEAKFRKTQKWAPKSRDATSCTQ